MGNLRLRAERHIFALRKLPDDEDSSPIYDELSEMWTGIQEDRLEEETEEISQRFIWSA